MNEIQTGLTYDDVLLVPKRSDITSRKEVSLATNITKKIRLNIPIIPANMDSVSEATMAIAMARAGGLGVIHRFLIIEQQVSEILKVKRSESVMIEKPYIIQPDVTLGDAKRLMNDYGVTSLLVVDTYRKLMGMLSHRDYVYETDFSKKVSELMTRREKLITGFVGTTVIQAKDLLKQYKIEKIPIIDDQNTIHGLITGKDIKNQEKYPLAAKDKKGRLLVGGSIGVKSDFLDRAQALISAGVDILVIDIAHGHSGSVINTTKALKNEFPDVPIMAGNIATAQGYEDLVNAGADCVKVGVGPGAVCTTRIITGAGVPQLTAVMNVAKSSERMGIPFIADGGIESSGSIVKALAAGAHAVMMGQMFAGTDESPGTTVSRGGKKFKIYRGMASLGANMGRKQKENGDLKDGDLNEYVPEGVEAVVPYRGSVTEVLGQLLGGLRSGMSYCGAHTLEELKRNAEFIRITSSGIKESNYHDVNIM